MILVTRDSIVGYSCCRWTYKDTKPPKEPEHIGTVKDVLYAIEHDEVYRSRWLEGGYFIETWYVKHEDRWRPVRFVNVFAPDILLWKRCDESGRLIHFINEVVARLESDGAF